MPETNTFAPMLLITAFAHLKMTLIVVMALCLTAYAALANCIRQANIFSGQNSRFAEPPGPGRGLQFYNNIHMSAIPPLTKAALTLCVRHRPFSALSSKRDAVPYVNSG